MKGENMKRSFIYKMILFIQISAATFITGYVQAEYLNDEYSIKEHMGEMYNLRDSIYASLAKEDVLETANIVSKLREHLHAILPKVPDKIQGLSDLEKRIQHLQYQKFVTKVTWITIELEEVILKKVQNDMDKRIREDRINELTVKMITEVSHAHAQFRVKR
jgi:hypothetical protein